MRKCLVVAFVGMTVGVAYATSFIEPMDFPKTVVDVKFTDRMDYLAEGYVPFKDAVVYAPIKLQYTDQELDQIIEEMKPSLDAMAAQREDDANSMTLREYCDKYPLEQECNPSEETVNDAFDVPPEPITEIPPIQPPAQDNPQDNNTIITRNNVHGGACTSHSHTPPYAAKIYTSGKHASDAAFNKAMNTVFLAEGGCARERKRINSITCYGLTQRYNPEINVRTITRPQAEDYTYKKYYRDLNTHTLPDVIRGEVFHVNFWTGSYGTRLLRRLLNVNPKRESPKVESELVTAADNYRGDLFRDYMNLVEQHIMAVARRIYERDGVDYRTNYKHRIKLMRENGCHVTPKKPYK